jgi:GNAT superfamily N-acetyltransferase
MSLTIREARPEDFTALRSCMRENFVESGGRKAGEFDDRLWTWQYLDAPAGAKVILAEDEGRVCAYFHALLLHMQCAGRRVLGAAIQDVGTLSSHRGQGVFREMGRYALDVLRGAGVAFAYTFPNARSHHSFARNHHYQIVTRVPVYAAPLDIGPFAARRTRTGPLGRFMANSLAAALRLSLARSYRLRTGEQVRQLDGIDDQVGRCASALVSEETVTLERNKEFLTWRFLAKPTREYRIWGLLRDDKLLAYLVDREAELFGVPSVLLMDMGNAAGEDDALSRLLAARLHAERANGTPSAVTMGLHPQLSRLRRLGFVRVPERFNPRHFNLAVKPLETQQQEALFDGDRWLITLTDFDVL